MRGVNKVILVGTLGSDPETRSTTSGTAVCSFSVATNEEWKDKQSGEKQSRTEWHRVKVFGKLAAICGEYLKKGRQVYIEGSLRTDKYTDKQGVERYSTDIIADTMQMLGGNDAAKSGQSDRPQRPESKLREPSFADGPAPGVAFEDEIPFSPIPRRQLW